MIVSPLDIALNPPADARERPWRAEFVATLRLAMPIALTQLGQVAMMTTDLALVGRLGDEAVAAAALGQTVFFTAFVIGMGLMAAVAPIAAQSVGARQPRGVGGALRAGFLAAFALGIPSTLALLHGERLLLGLGQAQGASGLAGLYLTGLAWSLTPAWLFIALRNVMGALDRPEPALWITLAAIPVNFALAYALIHGAGPLPALGMLGAGLATAVVNLGMCGAAAWIVMTRRPYRRYRVMARLWRAEPRLMAELLSVGLPISGAFLLEFGLFACASLLMGWIGTQALAAHQIALQTAAIMFMVPFGIGMAATIRVGHAVGRRDVVASRRAGFAAVLMGAAFMTAMTILVILSRHHIPALYLGAEAAQAPATAELAATLLLLGATFFIFDGVQTVAGGALRGLSDTRVPLLFAAISFWPIGFFGAYGLGFPAGLGAAGVWIGLTIGLAVYAALLVWRFRRLTDGGRRAAVRAP